MPLFELDVDGDMVPVLVAPANVDILFELDGDGDLIPRSTVLEVDLPVVDDVLTTATVFDEISGLNVPGHYQHVVQAKVQSGWHYGPDGSLIGTLSGGGGGIPTPVPLSEATFKYLPRWMLASISRHFDLQKGSYHLFIEGQKRETNKYKEWLELRQDGPYYAKLKPRRWQAYVEINVLVSCSMTDQEYHDIYRMVGLVSTMFGTIGVYRFGPDSIIDTEDFIGCLELVTDNKREQLKINHFGQIDPKENLLQATVEGHYVMEFDVL